MLFQNIAALVAKGVKLTINIESADNGQLEVCVIPSSDTGKSGVNLVGKSFVATPAELDAEFADVIAGFASANLTLKEQLESITAQTAEALKTAQEAATAAQASKVRTPSPTRTVSPAKKAGPVLTEGDDEDDEEDGCAAPTAPAESAPSVADDPMPFML